MKSFPFAITLACLSLGAVAQHTGHGHAPYAAQQSRQIKALSAEEVASLLEGAGMGFAKAAELNRYPGPIHVERTVTEAAVDAKLAEIAAAQARLRGSHLKTHLATTALLDPGQIESYAKLRGYSKAAK